MKIAFRLVKGLTEHAARRGFLKATSQWPGDDQPEPA